MTDLIFHIGLAKCASTTLQRKVFRHEDGYIGTAPDMAREDNLAKQLQQCTPFGGRQTISSRGLGEWVERVQRIQAGRWPTAHRLILSNEILSGASRLSDRPILRVLSILKNCFWTQGRVRVVLVLRNQAARLASGYVQGSNCRWNPGQSEFERVVERQLQSRRYVRLLDYSQWVDGLGQVVGPDNVCVLLLEEADTPEFWGTLAEFCALERFDPQAFAAINQSRKNVRSRAGNRWAISELDTAFRAKVGVHKFMNLLWPARISPAIRNRCRETAIARLDARYRERAAKIPLAERETEIHLSDFVLQTVRDRCGPFNERLARPLGRDLEPLGY